MSTWLTWFAGVVLNSVELTGRLTIHLYIPGGFCDTEKATNYETDDLAGPGLLTVEPTVGLIGTEIIVKIQIIGTCLPMW